jgi:hypothetical protein
VAHQGRHRIGEAIAVHRCDYRSQALRLSCLARGSRESRRHRHGPNYWGAEVGDQLGGGQPPWDMDAESDFEHLAGRGASPDLMASDEERASEHIR